MYFVQPCWEGWSTWKRHGSFCPLCGCLTPSGHQWFNDDGECRRVTQAEGGEQGDPLMPLLFSLGIEGASEEVAASLSFQVSSCAHFWTMFIWSANQIAPFFCTISTRMPSSGLQASSCIKERPECGTGLTQCRTVWRSWVLMCGRKTGSPSWALQLVPWSQAGNVAQDR